MTVPRLTTLTRMFWHLRSAAQVLANDRSAAFVAAYTPNAGIPFTDTIDPLSTIEPPAVMSGRAFCTMNSVPFTLIPKYLSKCS
jgi:hypothetical protein